ncbi:hypothetical protein ACM9HF_09055 [Colwellia sp. RE-S-Sl-9]
MNKIKKETLLSVGVGIIVGVLFLVINLFFSFFESKPSYSTNKDEQVFISMDSNNEASDLLIPLLKMFGFEVDSFVDTDALLLALENVNVKIVAQSRIGGRLNTLLDIVTPNETKRISVTEGTIVKGFLIKSINNKLLILEKDKEEYTIKLFHPKEINQNRLENDIK